MNYIGSKFSILNFIDDTVKKFCKFDKEDITFCDIFSGTGAVGKHFKKKGYNIISNDIEVYSYITAMHFIGNNGSLEFARLHDRGIGDVFAYLNELEGQEGFIYNNYSMAGTRGKEYERQYYSDENAKKIDAIRMKIQEWKEQVLLSEEEECFLIASLIESADKVANTASVYEAFLKRLKASALKPLILEPVDILISEKNKRYRVYNMDSNVLIREIRGDILYLDPPYNSRKYDTNYHLLETIALYDNPEIRGKTGVRCEAGKRSKYCLKREASQAFEELIREARFRYILLSYNDEGIIPWEEIKRIMEKYGKYRCYSKRHRRYKADSKRDYAKDFTIEYIHCLEKDIEVK